VGVLVGAVFTISWFSAFILTAPVACALGSDFGGLFWISCLPGEIIRPKDGSPVGAEARAWRRQGRQNRNHRDRRQVGHSNLLLSLPKDQIFGGGNNRTKRRASRSLTMSHLIGQSPPCQAHRACFFTKTLQNQSEPRTSVRADRVIRGCETGHSSTAITLRSTPHLFINPCRAGVCLNRPNPGQPNDIAPGNHQCPAKPDKIPPRPLDTDSPKTPVPQPQSGYNAPEPKYLAKGGRMPSNLTGLA